MEREDIRIPPPSQGWDIIIFVDAYQAQIVGGISEIKDGKEIVKYLFYPFPDLKKRYKIPEESLTKSGLIEMSYPKEMIITLNEDDPARKIKFCLLNFEGKPTPTTKWFEGYLQNERIIKLRERIEEFRVHNAKLKEENVMLKTNMPKYIKTHFSALAGDIMPLIIEQFKVQQETAKKIFGEEK